MATTVTVSVLPRCDGISGDGLVHECKKPADFDYISKFGPWAYGCHRHWLASALTYQLGTGMGQKLIIKA